MFVLSSVVPPVGTKRQHRADIFIRHLGRLNVENCVILNAFMPFSLICDLYMPIFRLIKRRKLSVILNALRPFSLICDLYILILFIKKKKKKLCRHLENKHD